MDTYQRWAHDPVPYIAAIVDDARVFWRTPVDLAKAGLVNYQGHDTRWRSTPGVPVHYTASLTGPGISHSGDFDVRDWYWKNIVPLPGRQRPAQPTRPSWPPRPAEAGQGGLDFSGTATPEATVEVFALAIGLARQSGSAGRGPTHKAIGRSTPTQARRPPAASSPARPLAAFPRAADLRHAHGPRLRGGHLKRIPPRAPARPRPSWESGGSAPPRDVIS